MNEDPYDVGSGAPQQGHDQPSDPFRPAAGGPTSAPMPYSGYPPPSPHAQPQPPAYGYPGTPAEYPTRVAAKNPALALLASFFIPGLGTLMNGETGKGIGIFVGYAVSWLLVIVVIGILGLFGFWIWGMIDAYQGAQKWNARHGIVS